MGEQHAWIFLFAIVVPTLFQVVKLAVDGKRRYEDLGRRLESLERRFGE